jgi:hypothetical protein
MGGVCAADRAPRVLPWERGVSREPPLIKTSSFNLLGDRHDASTAFFQQ